VVTGSETLAGFKGGTPRSTRIPSRGAGSSKIHYAELRIMPTSVVKSAWEAVIAVKDAA